MALSEVVMYHIGPSQSMSGLGIKQTIFYQKFSDSSDETYIATQFGLVCPHCFGDVIYKNNRDPLLVCIHPKCRTEFTDLPGVPAEGMFHGSINYSQIFRWDDERSNWDNGKRLSEWIFRWTGVEVDITVTTPSPV